MTDNAIALQSEDLCSTVRSRYQADRRTKASPMNVYALTGRRKSARRDQDMAKIHHTDYHDTRIFWSTIAIILLCVFDAHYTLMILERGGAELNHLMDYLIKTSLFGFFVVKYTLTALSLFILVAYNKQHFFKMFQVRYLIYGFLFIYSVLVGYELIIWPGALTEIYPL